MYKLIDDVLISPVFDRCGYILFCDAAFTSIRLFRQLYSRGIFGVGQNNASKPEKGGNDNSWPHQSFKKGDTEYLARGTGQRTRRWREGGGYKRLYGETTSSSNY